MATSQSGGRKHTNSTRHPGATDNVKGRAGRILAKSADNGTYETAKEQETAVLVSVPPRRQSEAQTTEYLDELAFLIETAGATATKRFVQRLEKPDIRTYVGEGKLAEIKAYVQHEGTSMVVFDDDLSPSQLRNLEAELLVKIVDRSLLILDIFALRAKSATSRTQVELAQYQYLLPRLTGLWTHLDKQRGGVGMKGPGETEIETDRRIVRDRIAFLKEKLEELDKQSHTQRKSRGGLVRVALVGYTNVGKSTLMNVLGKAEVFAENKLFATVDATTRKVVLDNQPFLLSDTVGFIRKLPTKLIESFKSTLDEIREADLLLHVVDISHPGFEEQIQVVNDTLADIGAADKPMLLVFNKIDQYKPDDAQHDPFGEVQEDEGEEAAAPRPPLQQLQATYMAKLHDPVVFISAQERTNLEELRELVAKRVAALHQQRYPYQSAGYGQE
ncbi:GTPase HflX [Hymenobacter properus]|uniref:GTPase HflX n=1 Tax=Hymenobacter properus TaxID=2791026 RepID=A0A931FNE2_9BACT|nr:GTPase HflX [Hymenobacter properus]MBF9142559.1 GTPase HflX [Hymenobacter properus]MBR7721366.1 GTPase HflX [Microvirga sp. SRT04]